MIGITGGIGSGKSTICQELKKRRFRIYDTDSEAKRLIQEDATIRMQLTELLGERTYQNGIYQRQWVASQIFQDPELLQQINHIIHPAVQKDILQKDIDIIESAILYESGLHRLCDKVIAVIASPEIRMQRAMKRDHAEAQKIMERMRVQKTNEELSQLANYVLTNNGEQTIEELVNQLLQEL